MHVTLRAQPGTPSLRSPHVFIAIRGALAAASRNDLRLLHFSVQSDHLHLMVEAHDKAALSRGLRGLTIRAALAANRALGRRGRVWGDRYHALPLASPREVRNGLVYVLMNFRKHRPADRRAFDPCSSATWFDGFRDAVPLAPPEVPPPICRPRTWLAAVGWRRHGLLSPHECPRPPTRPPRR